jgi:2-keto-4-pentenoate hydratase/2-oxohepta-3-ene-1,7-dioic acid hydratase in catechol pathway
MLALIDGGATALDHARRLVEAPRETRVLTDVRLLAPVPVPRQMRDFLGFESHLRNARANAPALLGGAKLDPSTVDVPEVCYTRPVYYKCNRFSVVGPNVEIVPPWFGRILDYELEFGVFLSREGKNIPRDEARSYIFGYCIFNDVSLRDTQLAEMQALMGPAKGKDFDTGNVMGPWLVTSDEIPDPYALTMVARVNGEEWSRGKSGPMLHTFEDMIAYASLDETLHPGEFFGSGTVGGGSGLDHGRFLAPGDVIELEVGGLGVLCNRVAAATIS